VAPKANAVPVECTSPPKGRSLRFDGLVPVICRRYKSQAPRLNASIAGMPTPFRATRLLAELPRLRRYARILTDDPAESDRLVEETLSRARQMQDEPIARTTPGTEFIALLRAVNAVRTAGCTQREANTSISSASPRPNADTRAGAHAQSRSDRGAEMLARLRELPLEQREILVLVAVERLSYAEVGSLLQMPVATVISRLSQAREALRTSASKSQSAPHTY